jgi:Carbon-nitrogen hydrolase
MRSIACTPHVNRTLQKGRNIRSIWISMRQSQRLQKSLRRRRVTARSWSPFRRPGYTTGLSLFRVARRTRRGNPLHTAVSHPQHGTAFARDEAAAKMAAAHEITLVMGYSEREGGSRYMSQVIIGEQGEILLNRRKRGGSRSWGQKS